MVGTEKCSKFSANTPIPVQMGQWEDGKQRLLLFDRKYPILCALMDTRQKNSFCYFRPNRDFVLGSQVRGGSIRMNFSLIGREIKNFSVFCSNADHTSSGLWGLTFLPCKRGRQIFHMKKRFPLLKHSTHLQIGVTERIFQNLEPNTHLMSGGKWRKEISKILGQTGIWPPVVNGRRNFSKKCSEFFPNALLIRSGE